MRDRISSAAAAPARGAAFRSCLTDGHHGRLGRFIDDHYYPLSRQAVAHAHFLEIRVWNKRWWRSSRWASSAPKQRCPHRAAACLLGSIHHGAIHLPADVDTARGRQRGHIGCAATLGGIMLAKTGVAGTLLSAGGMAAIAMALALRQGFPATAGSCDARQSRTCRQTSPGEVQQ